MQAPRQASTFVAPSRRISLTVASITPASTPRQPAWATPTTPSGLPKASGAQSAANTTRRESRRTVTSPSPSAPTCSPGASTRRTVAPWTWRSQLQGRSPTTSTKSSDIAAGGRRSPSKASVATTCTGVPGSWKDETVRALLQERGDVEVVVPEVEIVVVVHPEHVTDARRRPDGRVGQQPVVRSVARHGRYGPRPGWVDRAARLVV